MQSLFENKPLMIGAGVVAILIGALLLLVIVRMLFGGKLRLPGGRTRQARLGIVDAFDLDRQRQLIIVRRDNTEHLIMIGGPNDLLIESEIVRVEARDSRRDKIEASGPTLPLAPGFGEPRIPAPIVADREFIDIAPVPSLDVTPIPAPLPQPIPAPAPTQTVAPAQPAAAEPVAAETPPPPPRRTPTFPLPPRRPTATPIEPRPPALKPADVVTRSEPQPPFASAPSPAEVATAAPPQPADAPPIVVPPALAPPVAITPPIAVTPPRPAPPPFLRPLPPRQPKILKRTTAPITPPAPPPVAPPEPAAEKPPLQSEAGLRESEPKDTLESLEEEMAKLLGRGSER